MNKKLLLFGIFGMFLINLISAEIIYCSPPSNETIKFQVLDKSVDDNIVVSGGYAYKSLNVIFDDNRNFIQKIWDWLKRLVKGDE